jgi:hypothetical protein
MNMCIHTCESNANTLIISDAVLEVFYEMKQVHGLAINPDVSL